MKMLTKWNIILCCSIFSLYLQGCESGDSLANMTQTGGDSDADTDTDADSDSDADADGDSDSDADTDTDSDGDTDSDSDGDSDGDSDSDSDSDSDTVDNVCDDEDDDGWCADFDCNDTDSSINRDAVEDYDPPNGIDENCDGLTDEEPDDTDPDNGPIIPDCSNCPIDGDEWEAMRCAIDLCDDDIFMTQDYSSPTGANIVGTHAAVTHFGNTSNDLAPLLNGSYALMATGPATGTNHSVGMGGSSGTDSFANDSGRAINDVMEWKLHLKAPKGAHGFQIYYVFFSEEYDEYVGSDFNDKFYIILEAASTNNSAPTVINFTECRGNYAGDQTCDQSLEDLGVCTVGDRLCYIAINTALSECCWYAGCQGGTTKWTTNIAGTGFVCAASQAAELLNGANRGSSTGWLVTEWIIEPEEEFDITFHIHDTTDHFLDSEVILDQFLFVAEADPGTSVY